MKCLKNANTGNIIRVTDKQADQISGKEWKFVSKTEWKTASRKPEPVVEAKTEEPTISEKQLKRKKK
jgi:hypothetical protein